MTHMKKFFYVIWAVVAAILGSLLLILNKELLVIAVLLGPVGTITVSVIAIVFLLSVYQLWKNRIIWTSGTGTTINK